MEKESGVGASRTSPIQLSTTETVGEDPLVGEGTNKTSMLHTIETLLRLLSVGLCVSALLIMVKNSQQNDYTSLSYTDLGAFRYYKT